jgi:hypothetical protein
MPRAIACRALHVDLVNIRRIAEHLLVIYNVEESRLAVGGKPRRTRPEHRADRAGGEADDLLLHSALSETGQTTSTRPISGGPAARRPQSAFTLIRKKGNRSKLAEPSRTSARKAVRASSRTGARAQSDVTPARGGGRDMPCANERFDLLRVASESAKGARERRAAPAVRLRPWTTPAKARRHATVKEHLDARTASNGRRAERTSAALPQSRQHAHVPRPLAR